MVTTRAPQRLQGEKMLVEGDAIVEDPPNCSFGVEQLVVPCKCHQVILDLL